MNPMSLYLILALSRKLMIIEIAAMLVNDVTV